MGDLKQQGIAAVNQDFRRFDQVTKDQVYHLAEQEQGDLFDEEYQLRTCDLNRYIHGDEQQKHAFVQQLGAAMEEIGFAILVGHGIEPDTYQQTEDMIRRFFEQTTVAQRMAWRARRHGSVKQGYFPIEETSDIHPDQVEGWVFCRRAFALDGRTEQDVASFWPLPGMEPFFRAYVQRHQRLFQPIMSAILAYMGSDPHSYDAKLEHTNFGLRFNYYPPIDEAMAASGAGRILGHEDVNLFTLLPAPRIEGLQALNRANNRWVRLSAPPGSIILNTGDYTQRITNDILPSTTHRVSKPRDKSLYAQDRISFPLAAYVWEQEMLEVLPEIPNPKYPPISALAFHTGLTAKFYGADYAVVDDQARGGDAMRWAMVFLVLPTVLQAQEEVFKWQPPGQEAFAVLSQFFEYDRSLDLNTRVLVKEDHMEYYRREKISFSGVDGERVPAFLAIPKIRRPPYPVVLLIHDLSGSQQDWWERKTGYQGENMAQKLLAAGFAVLTLDARYHGERIAFNDFEPMDITALRKGHYHRYRDLMVRSVIDYRRALDVLHTRRELKRGRAGVMGYGMGGLMSLMLSAMDSRVVTVVSCVTPVYREQTAAYAAHNYMDAQGERPLLMLMARQDPLHSPLDVEAMFRMLRGQNNELVFYDSDHELPAEYSTRTVAWFKKYLFKWKRGGPAGKLDL